MRQRRVPVAARFWSKVEKTSGCWIWRGGKTSGSGYGYFRMPDKWVRAHRMAWFLATGEMPTDCVCHTCDVRLCVRPDHLFLGTQLENVQDRQRKNRCARGDKNGARTKPERLTQKGAGHWKAKLNPEKVLAIRALYAKGATQLELAEKFNVKRAVISKILLRRLWKHVEAV